MKFKIMFLSFLLMLGLTQVANAGTMPKPNFDKPVFIKAEDLDENQLKETEENLGIENEDDYKVISINVNEVNEYLGTNLDYVKSSATIEKKGFGKGKGVNVEILTKDNITKVTEEQYMNASITAGITNADIKIASVEAVTGEGALTGIYKAYSDSGNDLNKDDIRNANQEMKDLSDINEENKGKDGYSDEALNASIADIKKQLAEIQEKQDESLTKEQVSEVVNETLKDRGLNEVVNEQQAQTITNNMYNITQSKVFTTNSKEFAKQAKSITKSIEKNSGDLIDKAKDLNTEENRNILQKVLDGIKEIFNAIIDFFKNLIG